jgi:quinol monooxygenase YgiN
LLTCAQIDPGMRGYEVAVKSALLPASADVCLIATFDDAAALQRYQQHPLHQQVSQRIAPLRKARHVLDHEVPAAP